MRGSGLAFGLALAVRPAGSAPGSRVGHEDSFCEAVRNDLWVPLTLEGPARTTRGVPARCLWLSPGDWRIWRVTTALIAK